jgi:hypothetical protein
MQIASRGVYCISIHDFNLQRTGWFFTICQSISPCAALTAKGKEEIYGLLTEDNGQEQGLIVQSYVLLGAGGI